MAFVGDILASKHITYQMTHALQLPPSSSRSCNHKEKENFQQRVKNEQVARLRRATFSDCLYLSGKIGGQYTGVRQHPAVSPDLNVMEDVWSYLDRHVRASKVTTIRGLKKKLTQLWNDLSWKSFVRQQIQCTTDFDSVWSAKAEGLIINKICRFVSSFLVCKRK